MNYRAFGKTGKNISLLGFGAMRLPTYSNAVYGNDVDEEEAIRMIRRAIDGGVNYVDTAFLYHGGVSEKVVGKALKDGYRQKTYLATKSPVYLIKEAGDFEEFLETQLERLEEKHIDFYLLHALNKNTWRDVVLRHGLLTKMEKAKEEGKIGHIGFSFHDEYGVFTEILNGYSRWEFCQIQLNYLDTAYQAGLKGLEAAAARDMGVIVMEPLRGGKLVAPAGQVREIFERSGSGRTAVQWALDWLWSFPETSFVLSGMSTLEQVEENLKYASDFPGGPMTGADLDVIRQVQEKFAEIKSIPCSGCAYCMPCPASVDIPKNFEAYNGYYMFGDPERSRKEYYFSFDGHSHTADLCVKCKICEGKCPQNLAISELMGKVHALLGTAERETAAL